MGNELTNETCTACGAVLTRDEIGLHKKLINRGATAFQCKNCLCAHFHMTIADADRLIANFRQAGCHLFD